MLDRFMHFSEGSLEEGNTIDIVFNRFLQIGEVSCHRGGNEQIQW